MGDDGLKVLAPALRSKAQTLCLIDLSDCQLSSKGSHILVSLLKSQYVKGQATKWEHSLRGRAPNASGKNKDDQGVTPLQRLTLNGNNLGDEGLDYLCDLLSEEIGLLALDMQANGITETGARMVSNMLTMNKEIQIVDIRNNAFGIIAQSVLRILKSHINQTDVLLLNDISGSLSLNRQFAIARSVAKEEEFKDWDWLDGIHPLRHTFYEPRGPARMLRATQASARKRALLGPNAKLSVGTENRSSLKELEKKPKVAWGSRAQLEVKAKSVVSKPPAVPQLASKQKQQQQQTVEQGILKRASLSSSSLVQQKHSLDRFHITASSEEPYHKLTVLERVVKPDVVQAAAIPHGNIKDKNTKPSKSNSRKKEKVRKALHALSIENARLKSQLTLLRSGITSVSHVLQENPCVAIQQNPLSDHQEEDSTTPQRSLLPSLSQLEAWSLPPLRPDQQGADDTRIDGTAETHASSLSRLILTMESSLDGFQAMLERLEDKEARRRKKRLARSLAAAASLGAQE